MMIDASASWAGLKGTWSPSAVLTSFDRVVETPVDGRAIAERSPGLGDVASAFELALADELRRAGEADALRADAARAWRDKGVDASAFMNGQQGVFAGDEAAPLPRHQRAHFDAVADGAIRGDLDGRPVFAATVWGSDGAGGAIDRVFFNGDGRPIIIQAAEAEPEAASEPPGDVDDVAGDLLILPDGSTIAYQPWTASVDPALAA